MRHEEGRSWWNFQSKGVTWKDLGFERAEMNEQSALGDSCDRDRKVFGIEKLVDIDEGEKRSAW